MLVFMAIHEQERNVTDRINPAQVRVELEAVKCRDRSIDEHEIRQVKVAVTLADVTVLHAFFEEGQQALSECVGQLAGSG